MSEVYSSNPGFEAMLQTNSLYHRFWTSDAVALFEGNKFLSSYTVRRNTYDII